MPDLDFNALREARVSDPTAIATAFTSRKRRPLGLGDNRLFLLAADHPARGALGVAGNPLAMASRYELLERLALGLSRPGVDGVLATPDIIEDLALLGVLENKIVVGSMNRGGLQGSSFEMDDRFTAYSVPQAVSFGLDMVKTLLRVDLEDPGTVATLETTAQVVTEAAASQLPILLEPFMSGRDGGITRNDLTPEGVIKSVAIASALGSTSAYSWLKIPVVAEMHRVMEATTLPSLLLGGDPVANAEDTYESWRSALSLPGVRGLVVGRALLYPADGDVAAAVDIAASLVHGDRVSEIPL